MSDKPQKTVADVIHFLVDASSIHSIIALEPAEVNLLLTEIVRLRNAEGDLTAQLAAAREDARRLAEALDIFKHGTEYPDEMGDIVDDALAQHRAVTEKGVSEAALKTTERAFLDYLKAGGKE